MASTYSSLKIQLMATGENNNAWGDVTNTNLGTAIEEAITGSADVTFASTTVTLTLTDTNATQTARHLRLNLTGTSGGAQNLIVPAVEKYYIVNNGCADTITIKNSTGTGIAVPSGKTIVVFNDATNVVSAITHLASLTLASSLPVLSGGTGTTTSTGTGSVVLNTSPTLVTPALGTPASGVATNLTGLPVSTGISGLGTGVATFLATPSSANLISAVTDETGTGALVFATSPTLVTPALGTPSSGVATNLTGLPVSTGISGLGTGVATFLATPSSANLAATVTDETGTGALVFATSPTLSGDVGTDALLFSVDTVFSASTTVASIRKQANLGLVFKGATGTISDLSFVTPIGLRVMEVPTGTSHLTFVPVGGGNVGIGTTAPNTILEIIDTNPTILRIGNGGTATNLMSLQFATSTGIDGKITCLAQSGVMDINSGRSAAWGGVLTLSTDTSERMRIDPSGNVGIGTTTLAYKLDVAGDTNASGKYRIGGTQMVYLPDQATFIGSVFYGDGGTSLSYVSGNDGRYNTAVGIGALNFNTTGSYNSAQGAYALYANTTGTNNSAQGYAALYANTTGTNNSAQGYAALNSNTTGFYNSAQGVYALNANTTGSYNSAQGVYALNANTTGTSNSAQGAYALYSNTTGFNNSAQGYAVLYANTTGSYNSAQGYAALNSNTTGSYNSAQGYDAGRYIADGTTANATSGTSLYLGASTKALADGGANETVIGYNAIGAGSNSVTLGNTSVTKTLLNGSVGIGTTAPDAAAVLDISSTTRGFLPPRMTTTQRDAIVTPPDGLMIYNSTIPAIQARVGGAWVSL